MNLRSFIAGAYLSIFLVNAGMSQSLPHYQYVFPKPNSDRAAAETNVIVRPGKQIDPASLLIADLITVRGSLSGSHEGTVVLSDDGRTIVFNPALPFADGERVSVAVADGLKESDGTPIVGASFEFRISATSALRVQVPLASASAPGELQTFSLGALAAHVTTDSLPADFPPLHVDTVNNPSAGELFVGGFGGNGGTTLYANYLAVLNNAGVPLAYKRIGTGVNPFEYMFKVEPNGYYSYIERTPVATTVKIVDSAFNVVDTYPKGNPAGASHADFLLLPNGHALALYFDVKIVDMSKIVKGGHPAASVMGNLVQEFDLNKNVVFQWSSFDYLPITDTYEDTLAASFDYSHANGIELDSDGNFLLSNRHLSEITKIDRNTGEVIWRMGGKRNQFTFINEHAENAPTYFSYMHNIRRLANGNILMFDNGNQRKPQYSRVVEYALDESAKTAKMVWEYRHTPDIYASAQGSAQRLANGNTLIGWGDASLQGKPAITEVRSDRSTAFELHYPAGYRSMRVYKLPWKPGTMAGSRTLYELLQGNTYSFSDTSAAGKTGVRVKFNAVTGTYYNSMTVERYGTSPAKPRFKARAPWMAPHRITIGQFGMASMDLDLIFDVTQFPGMPDPTLLKVVRRDTIGSGFFSELPTSYNSVTRELVANTTSVGEFAFCWIDADSVANPPVMLTPANRDSVNQKLPVGFSWNSRGTASGYQLQVARDSLFNLLVLNDSLLSGTTDTLKSLAPQSLFYWRIRSRNFGQTSPWSQMRSFRSTSPYISLTSPRGKENWLSGLSYFIQWTSNIKEGVRIEFFKGLNRVMTIRDSASNVGAFSWTIPSTTVPDSTYRIKVSSVSDSSLSAMSPNGFSISSGSTLVSHSESLPDRIQLCQNYPNPFNPTTSISYQLTGASTVALQVFDVLGRQVATLVNMEESGGFHTVRWDASAFPSGIYYCRFQARPVDGEKSPFVESRKMVLVK